MKYTAIVTTHAELPFLVALFVNHDTAVMVQANVPALSDCLIREFTIRELMDHFIALGFEERVDAALAAYRPNDGANAFHGPVPWREAMSNALRAAESVGRRS